MNEVHYHEVLSDLAAPVGELRQAIPEVWAGYVATHRAAMAAGELAPKHKELIALAISIVKRCDGCIASHARAAARAGASMAEVAEMIGVAILLDGGPATVYGPRALQAYQEFASAPAQAPRP